MIYAKCIRGNKIAKTKEEFIRRHNEDPPVYREGETTESPIGRDNLSCVPLNYIYDCLKYGDFIAIVDVDNKEQNYPPYASYLKVELAMKKQTITRIMKADSKEAIDFVFDNVGNNDIVHEGYKSWLSSELQEYFAQKKGVEHS